MVLNHHTGVYISCQPEAGFQSDPLPDFATALREQKSDLDTNESHGTLSATIAQWVIMRIRGNLVVA
jgi:hypothetical protein